MKLLKRLSCTALLMGSCGLIGPAVFAQSDSASKHLAIQSYLDSEVSMIGWVDVNKLDLEQVKQLLDSMSITPLPDQQTEMVQSVQKLLQESKVDRLYLVGGLTAFLGDASHVCAVLTCPDPSKVAKAIRSNVALSSLSIREGSGAVMVGASSEAIDRLVKVDDKPLPSILAAVDKAEGDYGFLLAPPPAFFLTVVRMLPQQEIDGQVGTMLKAASDMQWMAIYGQSSNPVNIDGAFKNAEGAAKFVSLANALIGEALPGDEPIRLLAAKDASVGVDSKAFAEIMPKAIASARGSAALQASSNNLKQIGLAFHNFASAHNAFVPQALTSEDGKRLLSWRVLLLPYIDQLELYNQFHLDEPWDSPHNKTLIEKMPAIYASPTTGEAKPLAKGQTRYLAPLTDNSILGTSGKEIFFQHVTDGTSNTIWLVEATPDASVIWTKPDDLVVDSANPLAKLVASGKDNFLASFADGSVRRISGKIKTELANALFSISGGEVIESEALDGK